MLLYRGFVLLWPCSILPLVDQLDYDVDRLLDIDCFAPVVDAPVDHEVLGSVELLVRRLSPVRL